MNLDRFNEFKRLARIQCESSDWLCDQVQVLVDKCQYYEENPHLDTGELYMEREYQCGHLENKCIWEDNLHTELMEEYKDIL